MPFSYFFLGTLEYTLSIIEIAWICELADLDLSVFEHIEQAVSIQRNID